MGCDAHMYVEYKKESFRDNYWSSVGGRINPGRNYWMFGLIAEVRCDFPNSLKQKGLPENLGYKANSDAHMYINDEYADDYNEYVTLATAEKWAGYGEKIIYHEDGKPWKVTHPDWHSHTWLTCDEFKSVIDNYNSLENSHKEVEYEAILSMMESLNSNGCESRLVIWFDN